MVINMKFSVGYQQLSEKNYLNSICDNKNEIAEVYFAFPNIPNGRGIINSNFSELEYNKVLENDISILSNNNIPINLLLNGMCYGKDSQSRSFFLKLGDIIDYLYTNYNLNAITTTSPLIAKFVKENFSKLDVRASVNMEIGTVEGLDYVAEYFDSFYAKRECNRDFNALKKLRLWCDKNNKKLYGLANSGCLNYCSVHTFHDNLVAHENEISTMDNAYQFEGQCRTYLNNSKKRENWFCISNFIRPEDVPLYEDFFDGLKLATRINNNPLKILNAYINKSFKGNLPEIMEPNHSDIFYPYIIENKKIPNDFGKKVLNCYKKCESCGYCKNVFKDCLICLE